MNRMIATTADARYAPGVALIAENANLSAQVRELERRVEFYKNIWDQVCDENDRLRELLAEERRESARARAEGARAERRAHDPYIARISARTKYDRSSGRYRTRRTSSRA